MAPLTPGAPRSDMRRLLFRLAGRISSSVVVPALVAGLGTVMVPSGKEMSELSRVVCKTCCLERKDKTAPYAYGGYGRGTSLVVDPHLCHALRMRLCFSTSVRVSCPVKTRFGGLTVQRVKPNKLRRNMEDVVPEEERLGAVPNNQQTAA